MTIHLHSQIYLYVNPAYSLIKLHDHRVNLHYLFSKLTIHLIFKFCQVENGDKNLNGLRIGELV